MSSALLDILRGLSKKAITTEVAEDLIKAFKNVELESGLKKIFNKIEFRLSEAGEIIANNGIKASVVESIIRSGDLKGLAKTLKLNATITESSIKGLEKIVSICPEFKIKQLDEISVKVKKGFKELDVGIDGKSFEELSTTMNPATKNKYAKMFTKIKTYVGTAAVLVGIFAVIYLAGDYLHNLYEATKQRAGCFLSQTTLGKTTSGKLTNRTCVDKDVSGNEAPNGDTGIPINPKALVATYLDSKANMKTIFDADVDVYESNVSEMLTSNYDKLSNYFEANWKTIGPNKNICYDSSVLESELSRCRACNPSAESNDITYVDSSKLPNNVSLSCVPPGSMLDTLIDGVTNSGLDILSIIGGFFGINSTTIKYVVYAIAVIFIIYIATKLFSGGKKKTVTIAAAPPPQVNDLPVRTLYSQPARTAVETQ